MYDAKDLGNSSVKVTIKTDSINTNQIDRDNHLRSPDFLDVQKFPAITFESTKIVKKGGTYEALGKLTIKGVTKEVRIPFALNGPVKDPWGNTRIGIEGALTINRLDYGVSWNKTLDNGGLVVANDVKIDLVIEGVQAK
jgi:polyisoprenoid-binding protein YceI